MLMYSWFFYIWSFDFSENDVYFSPPPTVVDIHSVESVYSKKDLQDSHMHHLLEDAMFRPRKTVSREICGHDSQNFIS